MTFANRCLSWMMLVAGSIVASGIFAEEPKAKPASEKKGPSFTISKETTFITEPLFADGFPNYPASMDRRLSQGVTPDNNAFVPLLRIIGPAEIPERLRPQLYRKAGMEPLPADGKYLIGSGEFEKQLRKSKPEDGDAFQKQQQRATESPWVEADAPLVAKWLGANEQRLNDLPEVVARDKYYAPILLEKEREPLLTAILPYLQPMRDLARAMVARGMRRIAAGELEKAQADSLVLHRLSRKIAQGPFLIDYLVGIAVESMAHNLDKAIAHHGKLTSAQAKAFAAELARLPPLPTTSEKFDAERFAFLDAVTQTARSGPDGLKLLSELDLDKPKNPGVAAILSQNIEWDATFRIGNEAYDKLIAGAKKADWKDRWSAIGQVYRDLQAQQKKEEADPIDWITSALDAKVRARKAGRFMGHLLTSMLLPAMETVVQAEEREIVKRELVQIALAMAAYRADNGKYPETLAPLAPKYLAKLPVDPWSGKDYIYRAGKEGYVLYGIGTNQKDDGGNPNTNEDYVLEVK